MLAVLSKPFVATGIGLLSAMSLGMARCLDFSAKRVPLPPPAATSLQTLMPQVAAGAQVTGAQLWKSAPLVALVLRRPG